MTAGIALVLLAESKGLSSACGTTESGTDHHSAPAYSGSDFLLILSNDGTRIQANY
jgi:hypothetical protein